MSNTSRTTDRLENISKRYKIGSTENKGSTQDSSEKKRKDLMVEREKEGYGTAI
jgi:hypothetical protein